MRSKYVSKPRDDLVGIWFYNKINFFILDTVEPYQGKRKRIQNPNDPNSNQSHVGIECERECIRKGGAKYRKPGGKFMYHQSAFISTLSENICGRGYAKDTSQA